MPIVFAMALMAGAVPALAALTDGAPAARSAPVVARVIVPAMIRAVAPVRPQPHLVRVAQFARGDEMKWEDSFDAAPSRTFVAKERTIEPMFGPESIKALYLAIARYQIIVNRGGWPRVPTDRVIGVNSYGKSVLALRRRLEVGGDIAPGASKDPKSYDMAMDAAVRKFQARHGLKVTGIVAGDTMRELNVSANERLRALQANVSRMGRLTRNLGARYVVVNIPAAQAEAVEDGFVYSRHNVVVGMPDRPTPILASEVHQLNFNPYWHVPVSIVEKDLLPKIRKDRNFLKKMKMRVYEGRYDGTEVDPEKIDWDTVKPDRYLFRQDPGPESAMASVKINFPNKYAVYLHDTPTKSLFGRAERFFSSGCVRVEKIQLLLEWLLKGDPSWDREKIKQMAVSGERLDVKLKRPVPIRLVYLTAWATRDGTVSFRRDLYGLDAKFVAANPDAGLSTAPRGTVTSNEVVEPAVSESAVHPEKEAILPSDEQELALRATGRIDTSPLDDDISEDVPPPVRSGRAEASSNSSWADDQTAR